MSFVLSTWPVNNEQSAVMFLYLHIHLESGNHPTISQPFPLRPRCFVTAAAAVDCTSPAHSPGGVPVQGEDSQTDNSWSPNESEVTSNFDRKF